MHLLALDIACVSNGPLEVFNLSQERGLAAVAALSMSLVIVTSTVTLFQLVSLLLELGEPVADLACAVAS